MKYLISIILLSGISALAAQPEVKRTPITTNSATFASPSAGQYIKVHSVTSGRITYTNDTPAGSGDVTAAANFGTDNVLVRADGTGKGVQNTGITANDTNGVSIPGGVSAHEFKSTNTIIGLAGANLNGAVNVGGATTISNNLSLRGSGPGAITLWDSDESHHFRLNPNPTTTTNINLVPPDAPYDGFWYFTLSSGTNMTPTYYLLSGNTGFRVLSSSDPQVDDNLNFTLATLNVATNSTVNSNLTMNVKLRARDLYLTNNISITNFQNTTSGTEYTVSWWLYPQLVNRTVVWPALGTPGNGIYWRTNDNAPMWTTLTNGRAYALNVVWRGTNGLVSISEWK